MKQGATEKLGTLSRFTSKGRTVSGSGNNDMLQYIMVYNLSTIYTHKLPGQKISQKHQRRENPLNSHFKNIVFSINCILIST